MLFTTFFKIMQHDSSNRLTVDQIELVNHYIQLHLGDSALTIDKLARVVDMSEFHFARLFKATTGTSPHQYVMNRRIQLVKTLLRTTDLLLSAIAHQAGFADHSHMGREFRRVTGKTPSEWRQQKNFWE